MLKDIEIEHTNEESGLVYRVEDKYICTENELVLLQERLKFILKPDTNQKSEIGYTVTSVYFDDLFDSHLKDTVEGIGQRQKYRIRIYNNSLDVIKLEIKYKQYSRVMKNSCQISEEQMRMLLSGHCIESQDMSIDNPIVLFNLAIKNKGLRPKVIVEYDRKAYIFPSGNVRITFDRNLRTGTQIKKFGETGLVLNQIAGMQNVLEVKYDKFLPGFIAQLLESGNMNQGTYSKYRLCREKNEGETIWQQRM